MTDDYFYREDDRLPQLRDPKSALWWVEMLALCRVGWPPEFRSRPGAVSRTVSEAEADLAPDPPETLSEGEWWKREWGQEAS